jgi:hypothetical protein
LAAKVPNLGGLFVLRSPVNAARPAAAAFQTNQRNDPAGSRLNPARTQRKSSLVCGIKPLLVASLY